MFGALGGVLPFRLGGTAQNGVTAAQHARLCADLVALGRVQPLASWRYTLSSGVITVSGYAGRNGVGAAHAPVASLVDTGSAIIPVFSWPVASFPDPLDPGKMLYPLPIVALATPEPSPFPGRVVCSAIVFGTGVSVEIHNTTSGVDSVDGPANVTVWGTLGPLPQIGDYGGELEKHDSHTEGAVPYADAILRQIQQDRGTAYTKQSGTLVDVENVALARFLAATGPRTAEKLRANATPRRSDERLEYWQRVLGIPRKAGEPRWRTRQKLAAAYRVSLGPTTDNIRSQVSDLLGDAFVDVSWETGADLDNPPAATYWPGVNPGDESLSLGGGAWSSHRAHLLVTVQRPSGMALGDYNTLLDVDLFQLLDQLLPAWATFSWSEGGGFILGESLLGYVGLTDT
ncbi:MAG TPA: hypothetical protein VFR23_24655 [Jiangellaceae bacterium]|nr:hypothetical protein [Jiangellaceae bacterium]